MMNRWVVVAVQGLAFTAGLIIAELIMGPEPAPEPEPEQA